MKPEGMESWAQLMLAQAPAPPGVEPWGQFILMVLLQGGALALLAWMAIKGLPAAVAHLAQMRTEDRAAFEQRTRAVVEEIAKVREWMIAKLVEGISGLKDAAGALRDAADALHGRRRET